MTQTSLTLPETPLCGRCQEPMRCADCGSGYVAYDLRPEEATGMREAMHRRIIELEHARTDDGDDHAEAA